MIKNKGKKLLSDLKFYNDYSKWNYELGRYETWEEACESVFDTHLIKYKEFLLELRPYLDKALVLYKNKSILASQRNLQYRGQQVLSKNERIYNCATTYMDSVDKIHKAFFLSLCGCGVGVSLLKRWVRKLPNIIKRDDNKVKHVVVEDSIEGWADAAGVLISSFCDGEVPFPEYRGCIIHFDYSAIRPKGAMISGGYKAPGPDGLKQSLERIESLLSDESLIGKQMKSITAYDAMMHLADATLSGGVRRAAFSVIIDPTDEDMIAARTGNWRETNKQRERSNNSIGLKRNDFSYDTLESLVKLNNGMSDLGFCFLTSDYEVLNPCFEIDMAPIWDIEQEITGIEFCVAGDTKLITKHGIVEIAKAVGVELEIWNGKEWSKVKPFKTGDANRLHRVQLSDGSYLDATDNHKFLVKDRFNKDFFEVETLELKELLNNSKYAIQVPRSNMVYKGFGKKEVQAYNYGFILGDGNIPKNSKKVYAGLFSEDKKIEFKSHTVIGEYFNYNGTPYTKISFDDVDFDFCKRLKYEDGLPEEIFGWDENSILDFVSGWADADGSQASKGIRIYGNESKLRDCQLLLTKVGINCSLNLMSKKGVVTNLGERKNDVWYVQITNTCKLKTQRLATENCDDSKYKGKYQIVKSVTELGGLYESFCLTEDRLHQCVFNNVLTKQCNLTEINAKSCITRNRLDKQKFYDCCEAAAIIGTIQAGYTSFPYLGEITEKIVERESLIGVSITAWMDNPELFDADVLAEGARIVKETNRKIAAIIGINPAARCTTTKPSGNASVLLGCASGIHAEHSKRYFRIMQVNKESEIGKWMAKSVLSDMYEDSVWSSMDTDYVIYVPIENDDISVFKDDIKGIDHLEKIKFAQEHWINNGKNVELCTVPELSNNISCTVIVDDYDKVSRYLYDNQNEFTAVSFLSDTGDKDYPQSPFTSVLDSQELLDKYGSGVIFASGLIVDGLQYFGDDLWEACECISDKTRKLSGTRKDILLQSDWLRRAKQFAKNNFKGDTQTLIYCLKDVHLWHKWCKIVRGLRDINFEEILIEPKFNDVSNYTAQACSGNSCEIKTIG